MSTSLPEWNIGVGGKRGFVRREVKLLYTRRDDGGDSEEGEEAADARTRAGTEGGVDEVAAGLEHRHLGVQGSGFRVQGLGVRV